MGGPGQSVGRPKPTMLPVSSIGGPRPPPTDRQRKIERLAAMQARLDAMQTQALPPARSRVTMLGEALNTVSKVRDVTPVLDAIKEFHRSPVQEVETGFVVPPSLVGVVPRAEALTKLATLVGNRERMVTPAELEQFREFGFAEGAEEAIAQKIYGMTTARAEFPNLLSEALLNAEATLGSILSEDEAEFMNKFKVLVAALVRLAKVGERAVNVGKGSVPGVDNYTAWYRARGEVSAFHELSKELERAKARLAAFESVNEAGKEDVLELLKALQKELEKAEPFKFVESRTVEVHKGDPLELVLWIDVAGTEPASLTVEVKYDGGPLAEELRSVQKNTPGATLAGYQHARDEGPPLEVWQGAARSGKWVSAGPVEVRPGRVVLRTDEATSAHTGPLRIEVKLVTETGAERKVVVPGHVQVEELCWRCGQRVVALEQERFGGCTFTVGRTPYERSTKKDDLVGFRESVTFSGYHCASHLPVAPPSVVAPHWVRPDVNNAYDAFGYPGHVYTGPPFTDPQVRVQLEAQLAGLAWDSESKWFRLFHASDPAAGPYLSAVVMAMPQAPKASAILPARLIDTRPVEEMAREQLPILTDDGGGPSTSREEDVLPVVADASTGGPGPEPTPASPRAAVAQPDDEPDDDLVDTLVRPPPPTAPAGPVVDGTGGPSPSSDPTPDATPESQEGGQSETAPDAVPIPDATEQALGQDGILEGDDDLLGDGTSGFLPVGVSALASRVKEATSVDLMQPPRVADGTLELGPAYEMWLRTYQQYGVHLNELEREARELLLQ